MTILKAARWYARHGFPVLPCQVQGKRPLISNGLKGATVEVDTIDEWWGRWPEANIGLRTGVAFDVLDIDDLSACDTLDALAATPEAAECSGPMATTGKGWHFWFLPTGFGNRAGLVAGADWRGRDGYVIAPPSIHATGRRYEWVDGPDTPLEAPPAAVLALLTPRPGGDNLSPPAPRTSTRRAATAGYNASGLVAEVALAPEGKRNFVLYWAVHRVHDDVQAGKLRDPVPVLEQLFVAALRAGLGEDEADATIDSAYPGALPPKKARPA